MPVAFILLDDTIVVRTKLFPDELIEYSWDPRKRLVTVERGGIVRNVVVQKRENGTELKKVMIRCKGRDIRILPLAEPFCPIAKAAWDYNFFRSRRLATLEEVEGVIPEARLQGREPVIVRAPTFTFIGFKTPNRPLEHEPYKWAALDEADPHEIRRKLYQAFRM